MNRHVRFLLAACVLASLAFALAAIGWRLHLVQGLGLPLRPRPLAPYILLAVPVILAAVLVAAERHLAGFRPGVSQDNPRHTQAALLFAFLFTAVCQAWMGLLYVAASPPQGETLIRFAVALLGVAGAVRANFFAKLSPPEVDRPYDRAAWSRAALRTGWTAALVGLALVAAAMTLPLALLFAACLAAGAVLVGLNLALHRSLRPKPDA